MEGKFHKLDVDIFLPVPVDWSKLSDIVKNDVVKTDPHNAKTENTEDEKPDITNLATNTILNDKINEVKNEIFSSTYLVTNASRNGKRNDVKGEIPSITNLATIATLTIVENKIPNASDLVKRADYDAKIKDVKNKYFTTSDYNKFTNNARITAKNLINKSVLHEKIKTLTTKKQTKKLATVAKWKTEQTKIEKLQWYDLRLFIGQNCKSKGLSKEKLTTPFTTDNSLSLTIK